MKKINFKILSLQVMSAILFVVTIFTAIGCSTPYQTTNSQRTYTFNKGGIKYTITDTYTREVKTDTLKLK